jgi:hypothetical protein
MANQLKRFSELGRSLRIVLADSYRSNVVWFRIRDQRNHETEVCIDCRVDSKTRYRIFDRARHPNKPGACLLELGSVEEGTIVAMASHWLDSEEPIREGLTEWGFEIFRSALLTVGLPTDDGDA